MDPSKAEQMAARLAGLEAQVRGLRRLLVIPVLMAIVVAGFAAFSRVRPGRTITVGGVEIRDEQGRLRGSFGLDSSGLPGLTLYDQRGLEQIALSIPSDDTSALYFSDRGSPRVILQSSVEGSTSLRFVDVQNQDRAMVALTPDGTSRISLAGGEWEARTGGPVGGTGSQVGPSSGVASVPQPTIEPTGAAIPSPAAAVSTSRDPSGSTPIRSARAPAPRQVVRMPLSYRVSPQD